MAIDLSEHEQRLVASLRKQRDQWPSTRWLLVLLAVTNFAIAAQGFAERGWSALPLVYLLVAAGLAARLYRDWHGSATGTLLLRMLERTDVEA